MSLGESSTTLDPAQRGIGLMLTLETLIQSMPPVEDTARVGNNAMPGYANHPIYANVPLIVNVYGNDRCFIVPGLITLASAVVVGAGPQQDAMIAEWARALTAATRSYNMTPRQSKTQFTVNKPSYHNSTTTARLLCDHTSMMFLPGGALTYTDPAEMNGHLRLADAETAALTGIRDMLANATMRCPQTKYTALTEVLTWLIENGEKVLSADIKSLMNLPPNVFFVTAGLGTAVPDGVDADEYMSSLAACIEVFLRMPSRWQLADTFTVYKSVKKPNEPSTNRKAEAAAWLVSTLMEMMGSLFDKVMLAMDINSQGGSGRQKTGDDNDDDKANSSYALIHQKDGLADQLTNIARDACFRGGIPEGAFSSGESYRMSRLLALYLKMLYKMVSARLAKKGGNSVDVSKIVRTMVPVILFDNGKIASVLGVSSPLFVKLRLRGLLIESLDKIFMPLEGLTEVIATGGDDSLFSTDLIDELWKGVDDQPHPLQSPPERPQAQVAATTGQTVVFSQGTFTDVPAPAVPAFTATTVPRINFPNGMSPHVSPGPKSK